MLLYTCATSWWRHRGEKFVHVCKLSSARNTPPLTAGQAGPAHGRRVSENPPREAFWRTSRQRPSRETSSMKLLRTLLRATAITTIALAAAGGVQAKDVTISV